MTTQFQNITNQMNQLEMIIARDQRYILKHGEKNDARDHDEQWKEYKEDAQYNLDKWDFLKQQRESLR